MKKAILTLAVLALAIGAGAQDKTRQNYEKDGKTFIQTKAQASAKDTPTSYVWRDKKGNEYPIVLHVYTKGKNAGKTTCYVIRTSAKTGKEYKYYLPDGERIAQEILKETR